MKQVLKLFQFFLFFVSSLGAEEKFAQRELSKISAKFEQPHLFRTKGVGVFSSVVTEYLVDPSQGDFFVDYLSSDKTHKIFHNGNRVFVEFGGVNFELDEQQSKANLEHGRFNLFCPKIIPLENPKIFHDVNIDLLGVGSISLISSAISYESLVRKAKVIPEDALVFWCDSLVTGIHSLTAVSYTHLTLPTKA